MEETQCPACGGFNLTRTGIQKVSVTELWADGDLFSYDIGDYHDWVGITYCECDDCGYKWEVAG